MQHVVDLHGRNRGTLQRRHQDTAQGVAQRQAKAPLQWFCDHSCLTHRVIARLHFKLCWLNQFSPVLVDHVSLHSCLPFMSKRQTPEVSK